VDAQGGYKRNNNKNGGGVMDYVEPKNNDKYVITEGSISKDLLDYLKEVKCTKFTLSFRGGNDEGFLDVDNVTIDGKSSSEYFWCKKSSGKVPPIFAEVSEIIEEAAWRGIDYSGAGEGSDYGDNYTYDLETMDISHSEWYTSISESHCEGAKIKIE
jgi:hypothetical protein